MKKIISIFMALILCTSLTVSLTACGNESDDSSISEETSVLSEGEEESDLASESDVDETASVEGTAWEVTYMTSTDGAEVDLATFGAIYYEFKAGGVMTNTTTEVAADGAYTQSGNTITVTYEGAKPFDFIMDGDSMMMEQDGSTVKLTLFEGTVPTPSTDVVASAVEGEALVSLEGTTWNVASATTLAGEEFPEDKLAEIQTSLEFKADGVVTLTSIIVGDSQDGTFVLDGNKIAITDSSGEAMSLVLDELGVMTMVTGDSNLYFKQTQ